MLGFTSRYISSFRKNTNTKISIWNYFSIFKTLLSISQGSSDYTYPVRQFLHRTYTWLLIFCYIWKKLSCISPLGCFPFILITHLIFSIGIRSPPNEMSAPAPSVWRKKFFFFFLFVVNFVTHWNETAMGLHVFPIPIPPPTSHWRKKIKFNSNSWMFSFWYFKLCFQLSLFGHICITK